MDINQHQQKHIGYIVSFSIIMGIVGILLFILGDFLNLQGWAHLVILVMYDAILVIGLALITPRKKGVKALYYLSLVALAIPFIAGQPQYERKAAVKFDHPLQTEIVSIKHGEIQGVVSKDGLTNIYAGIPYAKAPVGELRWKRPVEEEDWQGVRDCSFFAPRAMQLDSGSFIDTGNRIAIEGLYRPDFNYYPFQEMSEDCLYLNVWAPKEAGTYPVLVYIHGGSLESGSSADDDINMEMMSKQGIVCITISYRLNVFGYFAHESLASEDADGSTGDYGLLDQIRALHWVQDNIAYFNGDPNNVTIAGESAGSSCVSALCVSPLASGLFKRAIGESSSVATKVPPHTFRSKEKALEVGQSILEEFNCSSIDELRKIPAEKLVQTKYANTAMTVDGYALPKTPYELYQDGIHNEEALLHGCNAQEADPFVIPEWLFAFQGPPSLSNYKQRLEERFKERVDELIEIIGEVHTDEEANRAYNDVYSAYWFNYPDYSWGQQAMENNVTTYRYLFNKENAYMGTWHSGEIIYAYGNVETRSHEFSYRYDRSDIALSSLMMRAWGNFIKNGNPSIEGELAWQSETLSSEEVMIFDTTSNMGSDPLSKYYPFFASIEATATLK